MTKTPDKKRKSDGAEVRTQIAALPWRRDAEAGVEIMLVSSRETKRWIIPKGWPIKGMKPHQAAAIEALEEAGLEGKIEKEPVGVYHYGKRLDNGAVLTCKVDVYPLKVSRQRKSWPEKGQRVTRWFPAEDAAENVFEDELAALIRAVAQGGGS
jgi:8-oxo-dGTP pyrophosphatase MutT (NUDIX family)